MQLCHTRWESGRAQNYLYANIFVDLRFCAITSTLLYYCIKYPVDSFPQKNTGLAVRVQAKRKERRIYFQK